MSQVPENIRLRAAGTANRLRLAQTDMADLPPDTRREYLSDIVRQAMAELLPQERESFREELLRLFPTWDINVDLNVRPDSDSGRSVTDQRELHDVAFLVARLGELAQTLDEKERRVLQERLVVAGLVDEQTVELPEDALRRVRQSVQASDKAELDAARVLEAAAIAFDLIGTLDQLAWRTWKEISPRSPIQHPSDLRRLLGRFLAGDTDISRTQVQDDCQKLRQLTAALISAFRVAGRKFASRHLMTFAPTAIEGNISSGWIKSKDAACWEKYRELAGSLDAASIENEILAALASTAEELMRGLNPPGGTNAATPRPGGAA